MPRPIIHSSTSSESSSFVMNNCFSIPCYNEIRNLLDRDSTTTLSLPTIPDDFEVVYMGADGYVTTDGSRNNSPIGFVDKVVIIKEPEDEPILSRFEILDIR